MKKDSSKKISRNKTDSSLMGKKIVLIIILTLFIGLFGGAYVYKIMRSSIEDKPFFLPYILKNKTKIIKNYFDNWTSKVKLETIDIQMSEESFSTLQNLRDLKINQGTTFSDYQNTFVKANINYNGDTLRAKIRLKGDQVDHYGHKKWSFKIKMKDGKTFMGMKKFAVQHPKTRSYIFEWLFHEMLKDEGIIALRYDFIKVLVNGEDWGIYALEENFDKRLIENNGFKEGVIIRFNEDLAWNSTYSSLQDGDNEAFLGSDVEVYQNSKSFKDPVLKKQYQEAVLLLQKLKSKDLTVSEVFNIDKMATYSAILDLMNCWHAAAWTNRKFYYNPIIKKLEPIGFDGSYGSVQFEFLVIHFQQTFQQSILMNDKQFVRRYFTELERLSKPAYLDNFFASHTDGLNKRLQIIRSEFPYYEFRESIPYKKQDFIRNILYPEKTVLARYSGTEESSVKISLANLRSVPISVKKIMIDGISVYPKETIILPAKGIPHETVHFNYANYKPLSFSEYEFVLPNSIQMSEKKSKKIKIVSGIIGIDSNIISTVTSLPLVNDFTPHNYLTTAPNFSSFNFLKVDEKSIIIKPGHHKIDRNLVIPSGYNLFGEAGTTLDLLSGASIISYSAIHLLANEDEPFIIKSTDSTGQGLFVISANKKSEIDHVIFDNLSNPTLNNWSISGTVSFYESNIVIRNTQFTNNRSEDGLNIIRSEFTIDKCLFANTYSDAFDSDFSEGSITNSKFLNCGNDGIDVSGTVIEISNTTLNKVSDKGISCGENSTIKAKNIQISDAVIGIASKDLSTAELHNIQLTNVKIGLTAFQKKSEYGGGHFSINAITFNNVIDPYIIELGSTLNIDNKDINEYTKNISEK